MKKEAQDLMFSSKSAEWETPQQFYDELAKIFPFNLDPAATDVNHKCKNYFTKRENGLERDWSKYGWAFLNPPYGREIADWIKKAYIEYIKGAEVVVLLPNRSDTKYMHDFGYRANWIVDLKGRLKFINRLLPTYKENGSHKISSAPFPSRLLIFSDNVDKNQLKQLSKFGQILKPIH